MKPHIVHIVADDLGWKDVGFNGCTDMVPGAGACDPRHHTVAV